MKTYRVHVPFVDALLVALIAISGLFIVNPVLLADPDPIAIPVGTCSNYCQERTDFRIQSDGQTVLCL